MEIDFDELRLNTVRSFNELTDLIKRSGTQDGEEAIIEGYDLEEALGNLQNYLAYLAALQIEGVVESLSKKVTMVPYDFDRHVRGDYDN